MRLLLFLYPRAWRRRYRSEVEAVLAHGFGVRVRGTRAARGWPVPVPVPVPAVAVAVAVAVVILAWRVGGARAALVVGVLLIVAVLTAFGLRGRAGARRGDRGDDPG